MTKREALKKIKAHNASDRDDLPECPTCHAGNAMMSRATTYNEDGTPKDRIYICRDCNIQLEDNEPKTTYTLITWEVDGHGSPMYGTRRYRADFPTMQKAFEFYTEHIMNNRTCFQTVEREN